MVPRPLLLEGVSFSRKVLDRDGELLRLGLAADGRYRLRTPLAHISPELVEATLLYEDKYFYSHFGINPLAMGRAALSMLGGGSRKLGASTITMQLARLRYGLDTRSIWGKFRQIERALAIEKYYSKDEILEAYFNLAPYGGNIEGVGAAALIYFQGRAEDLTLTESLSLVGVPQNPTRRNPLRAINEEPEHIASARARLSGIWLKAHPEDKDNAFFHSLPLSVNSPADLPFKAPHVSAEALLLADSKKEIIRTTIDMRLQEILERHIKAFCKRREREGIKNATALLLHWPSMEYQAIVGSSDFFNDKIQGQVDGTLARRSPGSTLKPFIYALALEQGLIHPGSLLHDSPQSFKGYDPGNADGRFEGPVLAGAALALSRNIPAISLSNRLSNPDLYAFLQSAHAGFAKGRDEYGLSLVLGGAELSSRNLATFYSVLANKGLYQDPVLFPDMTTEKQRKAFNSSPEKIILEQVEKSGTPVDMFVEALKDSQRITPHSENAVSQDYELPEVKPAAAGTKLLSAEAAALTLDMIRDNPSSQRVRRMSGVMPKLPAYWKTGTSNANRDAWAAGIFGPYVLVVWVGNFDGTSNSAFVGSTAGGELFFDIAESLASSLNLRDNVLAHMSSLNIVRVPVCADTGDIDTSLCPAISSTWFIPGVSPVTNTGIYRTILIDEHTGLRACKEQPGRTRKQVWAFWPADLLRMFSLAGAAKLPPPPFGPECANEIFSDTGSKGAPVIISPKERLTYHKSASHPNTAAIALQADAESDVTTLFWYYGNIFIGRSGPNEILFWNPPGGKGEIRVLDNFGRMDKRSLMVKMGQ